MKIFFVGSNTPSMFPTYKKIISVLKEQGHSVDDKWMESTREEDVNDFEATYKKNMQSIKNCEVIIAETSLQIASIGFLIATALNQKKPVLALYHVDSPMKVSTTLKGTAQKNKMLHYREYSESKLDENLSSFMKEIKNYLDTKFILIISPEIDRYLEWASQNKRMHKAQIVRDAVEKMMSEDAEWLSARNT